MRRHLPLALAALVAGLGVWAGWMGVAQPVATSEALARAVLGTLAAVLGLAALLGGGRGAAWLLGKAHPALGGPAWSTAWVHHLVLGYLGATALLGLLAVAGALGPWTALAVGAILGAGWLAPTPLVADATPVADAPPVAEGFIPSALVALLVALLALCGLEALAPPTDTDELFWHLAVPARILAGEGLPGGWLDPVASRPLSLQLAWAALLATGGEAAPKLAHLGVAGALVVAVVGVARAHGARLSAAAWGAALVAGSWSFLTDAGLAHDNLPAALLVLAGLDAALRRCPWRTGIALGAAVAVKYTAAPAAVAVLGVLAWRCLEDRGARRAAVAALIAGAVLLVPVIPWWIRNLVDGLHPLFPYLGWPDADGFVFAWPHKYGLGRSLVHLVRLPWELVFAAETTSFVFLGRIHPAWLLFLPAALWVGIWERRVRLLLAASAVALVGWFYGAQWIRHLLPLAPIIAVAFALAAERVSPAVLRVAWAAWLLLLPTQVVDLVQRAGELIPVVTGDTSRAEWLDAEEPAWAAIAWINAHTEPEATVALLFTGPTYLVRRPTVVGSVEDHTPTRYLLWRHGDATLATLREAGVDYVLVGRTRFLRKSYPFLDEPTFAEYLERPPQQLESLLPLEATLVFEANRHQVWSLDDLGGGR